jgi:DNA primase
MNVEDLLISKKISFMPTGKDFVVRCLNPEHDDRNPSMRIDQVTGIFNCFSCEYKGNVFTHFGEKANRMEIQRQMLKKKIKKVREESTGIELPKDAVPYIGGWRDIRPETYKNFGAFLSSAKEFTGRICFPIKDRTGKVVAIQSRTQTNQMPKYYNAPFGAKMPLYPIVQPLQNSVLLVEGIFDVLNLHDKGISNAICCFGVKNFNEEKLEVLIVQGISNIDIFLDNDEAGQQGAAKVKELCEKFGLTTRIINFGNKFLDAGALSQSQVDKLWSKLYA